MTTLQLAIRFNHANNVDAGPNPVSARHDYGYNWLYQQAFARPRKRARVCRQKWVGRYLQKIADAETCHSDDWAEWAVEMREWLAERIAEDNNGHCYYDCKQCRGAALEATGA